MASVPALRDPGHLATGGAESAGQPPGGVAPGHRPPPEPPCLYSLLLPPHHTALWVRVCLERRGCCPSFLFPTARLSFHWSLRVEQSPCWREETVVHLPCLLQSIFPFIGPSMWNNLHAGEKRLSSVCLVCYRASFLSLVPLSGTISLLERRGCPPSSLFTTEHLSFHWSLCLEQSPCCRKETVVYLPSSLQCSFFFLFLFFFFCPSVWDNHHFLCVTCPNFVFLSSQLRTHLFSVSCS